MRLELREPRGEFPLELVPIVLAIAIVTVTGDLAQLGVLAIRRRPLVRYATRRHEGATMRVEEALTVRADVESARARSQRVRGADGRTRALRLRVRVRGQRARHDRLETDVHALRNESGAVIASIAPTRRRDASPRGTNAHVEQIREIVDVVVLQRRVRSLETQRVVDAGAQSSQPSRRVPLAPLHTHRERRIESEVDADGR